MKNKKNKGILFTIIAAVAIAILSIYAYFYFNPIAYSGNLSLSLQDKQWIEQNKDQIINMAIPNNIPVYSDEGKGCLFSFLNDFKKDTKLEINGIPYNYGAAIPETDYVFKIKNYKENIDDNELIFYKDYYVVLDSSGNRLNSIKNMGNATIGVLKNDADIIKTYLSSDITPTIIGIDSVETMLLDMEIDKYNYIILPKNLYLKEILNSNLKIAYVFDNLYMQNILVLNNKNTGLNKIMRHYFDLWMQQYDVLEGYENEISVFTTTKGIEDSEIASFKGKRYIYGYVNNSPYDLNDGGKLVGINRTIIDDFSLFAGVEFINKKFSSVSDLTSALKAGTIDLAMDYYTNSSDDALYKTPTIMSSNFVILSHKEVNYKVDTLKSLNSQTLYVLNDSKLMDYINQQSSVKIKTYNEIRDLKKGSKQDLIAVDQKTYEVYKESSFSEYYVVYNDTLKDGYGFTIFKEDSNTLLANLLEYRISTIHHYDYIYGGLESMKEKSVVDLSLLWLYIILIPALLYAIYHLNNKRKSLIKVKNENKMKFIDPLTSLKNRYYLMSNLSKWNDNQLYPQAVLLVDLNNMSIVNDKYGHDKGDELIRTAANILINNQMENTDMMRTNGTEFMVYLIGYDEESVLNYVKKLTRLFKELPYEFGATIGYSMIEDEVKTIDDAISEATMSIMNEKRKSE